MARIVLGVGLATLLAYATTPLAILAARRLAFYDKPAGYKGHSRPTPYLGGTAVMLAFAVAAALGAGHPARTIPLLGGVVVLLVVGTVDDRVSVSPRLRVAIELVLGALVSVAGMGWQLGAGPVVNALVMCVWVVGVVNAFNLFDNMDGQASSMAIVVAAGAGGLALATGNVWVAAASAALCGACIGFLPYNLSSPARIFLGDGGSMPLGLAVAVLVASAARHAEPGGLSLLVGFLLVGIPALDTALVIVSRRRRGISVLTGGRDHLTHRTRQRMRTPRRVAVVLCSAQAALAGAVIVGSQVNRSMLVYLVLGFVVCAAAAIVALEDAIAQPGTGADGSATRAIALSGRRRRWFPDACLAALGLGAGLSPLFSAYYDIGIWVPLACVLMIVSAMALIASPPRCTPSLALTFAGLAGLGLWSLLSMTWADAAELASVAGNLWLTYAGLLLLLVTLLRAGGRARTLLLATGVGIVVVAVSVLVRLLGSDPGALFIEGRLNSPLGYINGEGCVFAMGATMMLALAERRRAPIAGAGAALAVLLAELALMSESRGAAVATLVVLVTLLCVVPGFRRRVFALTCIAAGAGLAASQVTQLYSAGAAGQLSAHAAHAAVLAVVLAAVGVGLAWAAAVEIEQRWQRRSGHATAVGMRVATIAATVLVALPLIAGAARFSTVQRTAREQWHAFVNLSGGQSTAVAQTRLFSGAGDRYDYWRVALDTFADHPLVGVGAGNYPIPYYRHRRTTEAIENPHSLELQVLSELGIVGLVLLGLFVAGVALATWRWRRIARASHRPAPLLVAALGSVVVWFVDTSGDWMHLLPGVTAIALCGVATLCVGDDDPSPTPPTGAARRSRLPTLLGAAAAALVLTIAGASLTRAAIARHYLDRARSALAADPAQAIANARDTLQIDEADLSAYYIAAAGEARFDRAAQARSTLLDAARQSPETVSTWVLLGDLETRAGDIRAARGYYDHALTLDPREPGLASLVADPRLALSGAG